MNGQPLRQIIGSEENMTDMRTRSGIKSVEWKMEKKVLEKTEHVIQMENGRLIKAIVRQVFGEEEDEGQNMEKGTVSSLSAGRIRVPQRVTLRGGMTPPEAANDQQGLGCTSVFPKQEGNYVKHPRTTEWTRGSRFGHLYKRNIGEGPPKNQLGGLTVAGALRRLAAEVRVVEKNPGVSVVKSMIWRM